MNYFLFLWWNSKYITISDVAWSLFYSSGYCQSNGCVWQALSVFFRHQTEYLRSQPENIVHLYQKNEIISFIAMATVCSIISHECISSIVKYIYGIAEQIFFSLHSLLFRNFGKSLWLHMPVKPHFDWNSTNKTNQKSSHYAKIKWNKSPKPIFFPAKFSLGYRVSLACHTFIFWLLWESRKSKQFKFIWKYINGDRESMKGNWNPQVSSKTNSGATLILMIFFFAK